MAHRPRVAGLVVSLLVGVATCRPAPTPTSAQGTHGVDELQASPGAWHGACPMHIEGADVTLDFVAGGAAFVFTTATQRPLPIRRAARRLTAAYATDLPPPETTGRSASQHIQPSPVGIATRVEYSDVVAGARVEVTAIDPRRVTLLQQRLQQEAARMRHTGECRLRPPNRSNGN